MGRVAHGVRGVRLLGDDEVVAVDVIEPGTTLLVVTENGFGKRTEFDEYRRTRRGGQGVKSIQTTERNGCVISAHAVREENRVMLISEGGQMICIGLAEVRVIGRNTQGVRLVRLKAGDRLVSVAVLEPEEEQAEDTDSQPAEGEAAAQQPVTDEASAAESQATEADGEENAARESDETSEE